MQVLFWMPPWTVMGNPFFHRNAFNKNLSRQINLLTEAGAEVTVVAGDIMSQQLVQLHEKVKRVVFSNRDLRTNLGTTGDPSLSLYKEGQSAPICEKIIAWLEPHLASTYDYIFLWETPAPFLETMYPDATVFHQMPGTFTREPYPTTLTFDTDGLYRHGAIFKRADAIQSAVLTSSEQELISRFKARSKYSFSKLSLFDRQSLDPENRFEELALLPLQVSGHYAFEADTGHRSQIEMLTNILQNYDSKTGLVVTQYVTGHITDRALTPEIAAELNNEFGNIIFQPRFDIIPSVSQHLLPHVDRVITAASSIGFQGFLWDRPMDVHGQTFMSPYAGTDKKDETIAFLLTRLQPLAAAITEQKSFLLPLMEELALRKREKRAGVEGFCRFEDIDPDYNQKVLESFRDKATLRGLERAGFKLQDKKFNGGTLFEQINDPQVSVISFDVFDTLLKRPFEMPADLYAVIENEAATHLDGNVLDFAQIRLDCEIRAREVPNRNEITLADIYDLMKEHYGYDAATIQALTEKEIDIEAEFISARPQGRDVWNHAIASGKRIILVSDMYLPPEAIEKLLRKSGYEGWGRLYTSCAYGDTKKGSLFDIVLKEEGISANMMLHIGDNPKADIAPAAHRGIRTFHMHSALFNMRENRQYQRIFPASAPTLDIGRSAIAGAIAHRLFDTPVHNEYRNSLFHGSSSNLGYAALGPLLLGYVLWLREQAESQGITDLYFLSREGKILKNIYDRLEKVKPSKIKSHYLYASRRTLTAACMTTRESVLEMAGLPYRKISIATLLYNRCGINKEDLPVVTLQKHGFKNADAQLDITPEDRRRFSAFCSEISDLLIEKTKPERDTYIAYLKSCGFDTSVKPAIVDIGWAGNMQGRLGQVIGRPITGYYYAVLPAARRWRSVGHKMHGYLGNSIRTPHSSPCVSYRAIVEHLICDKEGSVVSLQRDGDNFIPLTKQDSDPGRRPFIEEVHKGVSLFINDIVTALDKRIFSIDLDANFGERILNSFLRGPEKNDAALLLGRTIEDGYGGLESVPIIQLDLSKKSEWPEGARTLNFQKKNLSTNAHFLSLFDKIEDAIAKKMAPEKKYIKYQKHRHKFFSESPSLFLRSWGMLTKNRHQ